MIRLREFFDEKVKLPSPPAIAIRILEAVRKDEDSFSEIAEIIKSDPALTARILKLANSSLYGLSERIDSPSRAITVIGTQALKNIALSFVIIDGFQNVAQGSFDLDLFWRRAITAAVAAETVAERVGCKHGDIFVASLLQDFGVLILFLANGPSYTEVLDNKRISGRSLHEEETERFGFNHAEAGYRLFKSWNFPETICEVIGSHHNHQQETPSADATRILNLADKISSIYHGTQSNRKSIEVRATLNEVYGLEGEQATRLIDTIGERALEVIRLFSIPSAAMKPFSQIMQEANDELGRLNYSYEQIVLELTQAKRNAEQLAIELKRANDSLRELTLRDSLTNLYNHRYFQDVVESEIKKSIRYKHTLSLLFLDIDFFKRINDTYGHPVGDHVLKEISNLLIQLVRHCDIVARYGGEEFGIILPETGITGAKVLAHRLRRGIEQHKIMCLNTHISVTVSIGLASTEMNPMEISRETLITRCDKALYAAKRNGRNRIEVCEDNTTCTAKADLAVNS